MKKPASFHTVTTISAGSAVLLLPSQLCDGAPNAPSDLLEQPVLRRVEEEPDVGDGDHRQHGRREVREAQEAAPGDAAVDPHRHQQRERDRRRGSCPARTRGCSRATARRSGRRRAAGSCRARRTARGPRRPSASSRRLCQSGGDRRVVREEREQRRRRQQQQPAVQPLRLAGHLAPLATVRRRSDRELTRARRDARRSNERCTLLVRPQQPLRLALRVLHRLLGRLGAGERRLQPVVQRLGHALVVVRRQLGLRVRQLVARDRGRRESRRRTASSPASPRRRRAPRRSRCRCPTARRAAAWSPT